MLREDDGARNKLSLTDVDDRAVPKLDSALHCSVKLREHFIAAHHVVHRTHVEVPALKMVIGTRSCVEERLPLGLV
jgi:hypothetical protein